MSELLAEFTVWGDPLPKGRPRFGKGRAYTPQKTRDAETAVVNAFELACPLWSPTTERLQIEVDFYRRTMRKVDADNCLKLVQDALNHVLYIDDEQLDDIHARRFYGHKDKARTEVKVYILDA